MNYPPQRVNVQQFNKPQPMQHVFSQKTLNNTSIFSSPQTPNSKPLNKFNEYADKWNASTFLQPPSPKKPVTSSYLPKSNEIMQMAPLTQKVQHQHEKSFANLTKSRH